MCVSHSRGATYQINGALFFLKCTAKVQKIIMQTKLFNSYFFEFFKMLKCKEIFYTKYAHI